MNLPHLIPFTRIVGNTREKSTGYQIGNNLVVSYYSSYTTNWSVFVSKTGKLFVNAQFKRLNDAVQLANVLEQVYGDYYDILTLADGFPDANLPQLCQYTIAYGTGWRQYIETIEQMKIIENLYGN